MVRNVISVLCLLLASIFAAASLLAYQTDALLRDEEPIREIAGQIPEQEQFSESVASMSLDQLAQNVPGGDVSGILIHQAEDVVADVISRILDQESTRAAWDQTLQNTRTSYTQRLEDIFDNGSQQGAADLSVEVDLSPVIEATTNPIREALEASFGWLPFLESSSFDVLAPEVVVDVEAATDSEADPYTWATIAVASQYWVVFAVVAGALLLVGLITGRGAGRWVSLGIGGVLGVGLGVWVALTVASPDFGQPDGVPEVARAILSHVEVTFSQWAQPSWWIFTAVAGFAVIVGLFGAVVSAASRVR